MRVENAAAVAVDPRLPAPGEPGTQERFVVTGVPAAAPFYFALGSFDGGGNRSPVSNLCGKVGREMIQNVHDTCIIRRPQEQAFINEVL